MAKAPRGTPETLTDRALNRALLARQMLLRRSTELGAREAVEHLLGLQAQAPMPPYIGLWSRLDDFDPHELGSLLTEREAVRMTLMRGTVHLVTVPDALQLRPLVQAVIERGFNGAFRTRLAGTDPAQLARATREILAAAAEEDRDQPHLTAREVARRLIARGTGSDLEAVTNALRVYVPLVQVPPRGVWGAGGQAKYATIDAWTGRSLDPDPSLEAIVLRYLRAFGPASVMDVQSWSGLTKLGAVVDRLRPQLVTLADEHGRELFDLPGAPRPPADVPAPVRFLGEFDNVLLGHADRSRIVPAGLTPWMDSITGTRHVNNLLVDGMLRATWWLERDGRRRTTLAIRPHTKLTAGERRDLIAEAQRLLAFAAADGGAHDVRFETTPASRSAASLGS